MPVGSTEELVAHGRAELDAGRVSEALVALVGAYEAATADRRWPAAAWAANWIGHVHEHHLGDLQAAQAWFASADQAAAASGTDLPRTRATARFNAGLVEARRGRTTAAAGHFDAAATAAASAGDPGLEATCRAQLGSALCELGHWPDGLTELDQAGKLATQAGDTELASSFGQQAELTAAGLESPPAAQFDRLARAGLERCLAAVNQTAPGRILDAGCGSGPELVLIAERWPGAHVVGIDRAETVRSIRLPRHLRRRVEVRAGDLSAPMPGLRGFDVAVCHAVVHTVPDPGDCFGAMAQALRTGGELVGALFTDLYRRDLRSRLAPAGVALAAPGIVHRESEINGALAAAGFTGIETWTEAVELHIEGAGCSAHLERILGRPLEAGECERLLDATGRPLRLDLSPLSFHALAGRLSLTPAG